MKTFCESCGTPHTEESFPKKCLSCGRETFKNPIPVVVLIVPIKDQGVLLIQRNIPPQKGSWALPGGFIDENETIEEAALRELREETGISLDEPSFELLGAESSSNKKNLLIFVKISTLEPSQLSQFKQNEEVSAIKVVDAPEELAFSTHTKYLIKSLKLN